MSTFPHDPTGHVRTTPEGRQLVIERTFRATIDDVWASLTEPARFARWYGSMVGEAGPGKTITVAMTAEKEVVPEPVHILECDPPRSFVVDVGVGDGAWHLAVDLAEVAGVTTMTFVQSLSDDIDVTDVGPGWEFYADRLTASRDDLEMPDWEADDYQAILGPYYAAQ
jgi:uncharacterized protein YndB with AHSA1/START domain